MSIPPVSNKIVEISSHGLSPSMEHLAAFALKNSLPWEVELLPAFDENLLLGARGVRIDFPISSQIFASIATFPTLVSNLECFDSFILEDGKWYPRILLFETLRSLIVERVKDLDNRAAAYVIGEGEEARVAASVLTDLGFSKILFIGTDRTRLEKIQRLLARKFIGVDFQILPAEDMTTQTIQAGVLINCTSLSDKAQLQSDISYFNFMKRNGLVMDLILEAENSPILEEAQRAELRVISISDVYLSRDLLFLKRLDLLSKISIEAYKQSWADFLKTHPLSSYKKRHS